MTRLRWLLSTDHRAIGWRYLALSSVAVAIGTVLSLLMRIHLVWPDRVIPFHGPILPEEYLALVTMHGTLMVFFVLSIAPLAGFANLILPSQIGAPRMAFPLINAIAFWLAALALVVLCCAPLAAGGGPISGWTSYPPLSAVPSAGPGQAGGMDIWLVSIAIFAVATILSGINLLTTVIASRCDGMTWERLPLTVWGWFTSALLSVLAYSVLLAAIGLLFSDRHAGTSFFLPAGDLVNGSLHATGDGSPLLWLHLFWFFGHPEVYLAILPGMGLTSMVLANFARRRVFAYRIMIATTLLIGFLGILVWGHHMFVAGMSPFAGTAFAVSTMAIALPSTAKVISWIATLWGSRPRYDTPLLFALAFVSVFIAGGLTGPILAQPILDQYLHSTFFVVAHFHLIMAMAGIFGIFMAIYYWFPLLLGRRLDERLGRWHCLGTLLGAYATFLPMHLAGLAGEPRHYAQLTGVPGVTGALLEGVRPLQIHITFAALFLASVQILFVINLVVTLRKPASQPQNPWDATTLEWLPQPIGTHVAVYRGPGNYRETTAGPVALPQWQNIAATQTSVE
jgi:cytochrome c oxidase subunit 1